MESIGVIDIILVEDNVADAELTIRAFKEQGVANRIVHVKDGSEALDLIFCRGKYADRDEDALPKVVLLDLKLPKVSGLEVLAAIKQDKRTAAIPIVILTSSRQDPDVAAAYALGANSYLVKPVDFDDFVNAVRNVGVYWLLVNQHPA